MKIDWLILQKRLQVKPIGCNVTLPPPKPDDPFELKLLRLADNEN